MNNQMSYREKVWCSAVVDEWNRVRKVLLDSGYDLNIPIVPIIEEEEEQ